MTTISRNVVLTKPVDKIWQFLNDPERVGKCLPGCQEVKIIDEARSYWKIKVSVGIVSRLLETEVKKTTDNVKKQISFHIRTKSGDMEGDLETTLLAVDADNSKLDLKFDVKAVGAFSWVINQMIGKQSDKMAGQFVECVNSSL